MITMRGKKQSLVLWAVAVSFTSIGTGIYGDSDSKSKNNPGATIEEPVYNYPSSSGVTTDPAANPYREVGEARRVPQQQQGQAVQQAQPTSSRESYFSFSYLVGHGCQTANCYYLAYYLFSQEDTTAKFYYDICQKEPNGASQKECYAKGLYQIPAYEKDVDFWYTFIYRICESEPYNSTKNDCFKSIVKESPDLRLNQAGTSCSAYLCLHSAVYSLHATAEVKRRGARR